MNPQFYLRLHFFLSFMEPLEKEMQHFNGAIQLRIFSVFNVHFVFRLCALASLTHYPAGLSLGSRRPAGQLLIG